MGRGDIKDLGGFLVWMFKGFKGSYKESRQTNFSLIVGVIFLIFIVLLLKYFFN